MNAGESRRALTPIIGAGRLRPAMNGVASSVTTNDLMGVLVNNSKPFLGLAPSSDAQACADLLSEALELAREGKITSVGIVVCMDGGIGTVMAGKQGADLNIGCDDLKAKIHAAIFVDGNVAAKRSSIMRVR